MHRPTLKYTTHKPSNQQDKITDRQFRTSELSYFHKLRLDSSRNFLFSNYQLQTLLDHSTQIQSKLHNSDVCWVCWSMVTAHRQSGKQHK